MFCNCKLKFAAMTLILCAHPLQSATVEKLSGTGITFEQMSNLPATNKAESTCNMILKGEIFPGEATRLSEEIIALAAPREIVSGTLDDKRAVSVLCLDSPGGSLADALKIVESIDVATRIRAGEECLSACSIIFMSGHFAFDEWMPILWRVIEPGGTLGFHAPSLRSNTEHMTLGQVSEVFERTVATIGQIAGRMMAGKNSSVDGYFPASLFEIMLTTPSSEMFLIDTVDEAARWKIDVATNWNSSDFIKLDIVDIARICESSLLWSEYKSSLPLLGLPISALNEWSVEGNNLTYVYNSMEGPIHSPWCTFALDSNHKLDQGWVTNRESNVELQKVNVLVKLSELTASPYMNYALFPPNTRISEMRSSPAYVAGDSFEEPVKASSHDLANKDKHSRIKNCSLESEEAVVENVESFVNVRKDASLDSTVLARANLGERVEIIQPDSWWFMGDRRGRQCDEFCTQLYSSPSDESLRRQVQQCIDDKVIWAKVSHNGKVGFISTYFLQAE